MFVSGSMEPAFQRGDILFLSNQDDPIRVGEIVVFKIKDRDIPIVHRVMKVHEKEDGKVIDDDAATKIFNGLRSQIEVLTKGDNNRVDDRGLYAPGQLWLQREDILGRAKGTLRYLGMVTIILNDYPPLKYVLIGGIFRRCMFTVLKLHHVAGVMGLFVLTNKES